MAARKPRVATAKVADVNDQPEAPAEETKPEQLTNDFVVPSISEQLKMQQEVRRREREAKK